MGRQQNFGVDDTALVGVVMGYSVIFAGEILAAPISGCGNGRLALAPADDFDAAMVNRYALRPFLLVVPPSFCAERHKTPSARPHIPHSCGI